METYSLSDVRKMASEEPQSFSLSQVLAMRGKEPTFEERMVKRETNDLSSGLRRGVRDVIDTGAEGLAWLYDKVTGNGQANLSSLITGQNPQSQYQRVKEMNRKAKEEWQAGTGGEILPHVQRLGGNILATLPATSALGAGVSTVAPRLGAAISSGGMTTGGGTRSALDMAARMAGGGVNGYVSAGLVDSEGANTGAAIGTFAPPILQGANAGVQAIRRAAQHVMTPAEVRAARDIASVSGINVQNMDELARLRAALAQQGPRQIPGEAPTVAQILQTPGASQLQRSIKAAAPTLLTEREAAQNLARLQALQRVAPVAEGGVQQAADDAGSAISRYAIPAERNAGQRVNELFDAVPSNEAMMHLPLQQMQNAQTRFLGPGTFGKGAGTAEQAMQAATHIGMDQRTLTPRVVPFDQIQALRSSIGEAITEAQIHGRNQAAAALTEMKGAIDRKVAQVASGQLMPGEVFTPQAVDAWGQALSAHAVKKSQFNTGPQSSMFRRGGDGMPQIQGAEIPRAFFNNRASQVEDAQAFLRLTNRDPSLLGDLKRFAITDAAGQTDSLGNLTNAKFNRWLTSRSGATGVIFNESERATLKAVADDLRRAASAEGLGRSTGSDTAQKIASMTGLGLADSAGANLAASHFPAGRALLDFVRAPAKTAKAERISGLLADPERLGGLLGQFITSQQPRQMPLSLLSPALDPLMYRSAPLLYSPASNGGGP
jgi:hypothetical protein